MSRELRTAVIIEDDADIRHLLEATLGQAGFEVYSAASGVEGVAAVREHDPIVTTLDISLPDIDGFEVARRIRSFSSTYVLMLTGRSDEIDTLLGLEAGADDYVTKPFRPREVRARVEAMLRRSRTVAVDEDEASSAMQGAPTAPGPTHLVDGSRPAPVVWSPAADEADSVIRHGTMSVDLDARLTEVDGTSVHLTRSEFDILAALVSAGRRVLSKDFLVRVVWGEDGDVVEHVTDGDRRSLEVHVANLRRKLGDDAAAPRFVETVRGVGYRLAQSR